MRYRIELATKREEMKNITQDVRECICRSGIKDGICTVFCPHTTAGITINENADPDVVTDLLLALRKTYPDRAEFRHVEGNSAAHLKASVIGASETILIADGRPLLGTWQGIYFCEFDGPRHRTCYIDVRGDKEESSCTPTN